MLLKAKSLTPDAYQVIINKDTERPFSGSYTERMAKARTQPR